MITVLQRRVRLRQERMETLLPLLDRFRADGFAVEVEQVEQKKDQSGGVPRIRRVLDQAEGGRAVGPDAAEFAVKIGLPRRDLRERRGDRRVFMRPVQPGAG